MKNNYDIISNCKRLLENCENMSADPHTHVGCLILDEDWNCIGQGSNHMPKGCENFPWDNDPHTDILETKYPYVIHAEMDAVLNTLENITDGTKPYSAWVTYKPCNECVKLLIQIGIKEIYFTKQKDAKKYNFDATDKMCDAANVELIHVFMG